MNGDNQISKRTVMAMPVMCFWVVIGVCLLGIGLGSFFDYDISKALEDVTDIGTYFATFSPTLAYCLLPAGGACLFVGLKKKRDSLRPAAWMLLIMSWFIAVYYSNGYFGKKVRTMLSYSPGETSVFTAVFVLLLWAVLYAIVAFVVIRCLDDSDPDKLIAVGLALLVSSIAADALMQSLKQIASRPRYKYLVTLDDPFSEYRNWWQMIPYLAGNNDNYQSWPSGHMSIVGVMFSLPMLTDCMKKSSVRKNIIAYVFVCVFILLGGYNRIHMTNHFLSDVCFGTLNSFLLTAAISTSCMSMVTLRKT